MTKWETKEPIRHRPPLPEPVFKALVSLALAQGWKRWAAATCLAFSGPCRIGGPLQAALRLAHSGRFAFKSMLHLLEASGTKDAFERRPYPRCDSHPRLGNGIDLQHLLSRHCKLYAGSPSMYRRRWDFSLVKLGVEKSLRFPQDPSEEGV